MPVNQVTTAQLTNEVLAITVQINHILNERVFLWAGKVTGIGIAGLQAAPFSMTSGDATDLFNAAQDLDKFRKVWQGLMYVTFGATVNTGTPTDNDGSHFGYPFSLNPMKCAALGY